MFTWLWAIKIGNQTNDLPSPAHTAGFSSCNFTGFLAIFKVVTSQQQSNYDWIFLL